MREMLCFNENFFVMLKILFNRHCVVAREMTKFHEEVATELI